METTVAVAIVAGAFGAVGPLLSQLIAAYYGHKAKRLEVLYCRKAEAYRKFLECASILAYETKPEEHYREFMLAFQAVRLVSSRAVDRTMIGEEGLMARAWAMRMAREHKTYQEYSDYQSGPWHEAMDRTIESMRRDLEGLSR